MALWRRQRDSEPSRASSASIRPPLPWVAIDLMWIPYLRIEGASHPHSSISKRNPPLGRIPFLWRRQRDSNPRGRKPKRFSRPPRYDRFDMPPYNTRLLYHNQSQMSISKKKNILLLNELKYANNIEKDSMLWYNCLKRKQKI